MEKNYDSAKITGTIADMIDDHILVCSREGQIVFSNQTSLSILGYSDSELREKSIYDIIAAPYVDRAKALMEDASQMPSEREEFLLHGKHDMVKLHLKFSRQEDLIYLYDNEKDVEYDRIRKKLDIEMASAIRIHKLSVPERLPDTEHISFASLYIPAEELGGDLFDAFKVDNGLLNDYFEQYLCFIADVSGHGLDSAMLALFVKDTIRSFFRLKHIPGQLLSPSEIMNFFIEQYLKEGYPKEYLVCLIITVFDFKTKELTYCNAGFQICPLLIKDENSIIELDKAGLPVSTAFHALMKYEDSSLPLAPEMTLLLMTDGLPEQRSENEFYEGRLRKLIPEVSGLKPADMIKKIQEDFTGFLKYEKIKDDITMVAVKLSETLT